MTELNESLARFMGWRTWETIEDARFEYHRTRGWFPAGDHLPKSSEMLFTKHDWNPCGDLNQASLVIKKLGEMGKGPAFTVQLAAITSQWVDPPYAERLISLDSDALWNMLTASPLALCQAAYKVIKGGEV